MHSAVVTVDTGEGWVRRTGVTCFLSSAAEPADPGPGGVSGGGGSPRRPEVTAVRQDELRHGGTPGADGGGIQQDQRPHRHPVHTGERGGGASPAQAARCLTRAVSSAGAVLVPEQVLRRPEQQRGGGGLRHPRAGGERLQQSAVTQIIHLYHEN